MLAHIVKNAFNQMTSIEGYDDEARSESGDQHLLALTKEIPVYSPREFLELINSGGERHA